jgi:large subunit ribosomal protein L6
MSKIGRKPIELSGVKVEVKGNELRYSGSKSNGVYVLPKELVAEVKESDLFIKPNDEQSKHMRQREVNRIWGLHRALIANAVKGAQKEFEKQLKITGLGYKAAVSGKKVVFSLGYSHKKDFELPDDVSLEVDKSGQLLTVRSKDKMLAGQVCSKIKQLRMPEPYKGTGIQLTTEVIARKAGKAKSGG